MTETLPRPDDPRADWVRRSVLPVFGITAAVSAVMLILNAAHDPAQGVEFAVECLTGTGCGLAASRWMIPQTWFNCRFSWKAVFAGAAVVSAPVLAELEAIRLVVYHHGSSWLDVLEAAPQVYAVSLVMTGLAVLLVRQGRSHATHAAPEGAPPAKFLARLPAKLEGADLFAVEAEDHYLRLHTSKGQDLILMRLADAVAELEGLEGAQTHRSWWVAKDAVASAERLDGRAVLTLKDGAEAPVSRAYAKTLRAAGWF